MFPGKDHMNLCKNLLNIDMNKTVKLNGVSAAKIKKTAFENML